jgi:hypothetical protein
MVVAGPPIVFKRHGLQNHDPCTLCSQGIETIDHLFMQCVLSREIWYKLLRSCGWHHLAPTGADHLIDWWLRSRKLVTKARRKAFDSLVVLITWNLWLERNSRVFRYSTSTTSRLPDGIWSKCELCCAKLIVRSELVGL